MPGVRAISKLDELGDSVRQVIKAYHGSPYDFDKFDATMIGAGEGAQAYGHGLYFAGQEDVARGYRDKLKDLVDVGIEAPPDIENAKDAAFRNMIETARVARMSGQSSPQWKQLYNAHEIAAAEYNAAANRWREATRNTGRMYEVDIAHPEDSLLDYDSPFGKNSGVVAAEVLARKSPGIIPDQTLRAIQDGTWASRDFTYGDSPLLANRRIQKFSKTPEGAAALLDAGIPGIRYLDGMSRSAGDGTRNYVMFPGTEDSIRILRKYGMMAPIAAGAAAGGEDR